jgi:hypothetical protein
MEHDTASEVRVGDRVEAVSFCPRSIGEWNLNAHGHPAAELMTIKAVGKKYHLCLPGWPGLSIPWVTIRQGKVTSILNAGG